ncbi:MAG TPA: hypothetical protein ENI81_12665 [Phycisphaerales bacterium]|nr:hypothetical protein [Phycisphaerales bacterium]
MTTKSGCHGQFFAQHQAAVTHLLAVGSCQATVAFVEPQFAPCPGQRLVLYDEEDNLLGGGTITAA